MAQSMAKGTSRRSRRRSVWCVGDEPTLIYAPTDTTQRPVVTLGANGPPAAGGRSCHMDPPKECRPGDVDGRLSHLAGEILACAVALACQLDEIHESGGSPVTLITPARVSAHGVSGVANFVDSNRPLMAPSAARARNGCRLQAQPYNVT
jgi:hypothetical protein